MSDIKLTECETNQLKEIDQSASSVTCVLQLLVWSNMKMTLALIYKYAKVIYSQSITGLIHIYLPDALFNSNLPNT